jgi:hypothetical protein
VSGETDPIRTMVSPPGPVAEFSCLSQAVNPVASTSTHIMHFVIRRAFTEFLLDISASLVPRES